MADELRRKRMLLRDAEESARLYDGRLVIRGAWTMDGAATLTDAARRLRDRAEELEWLGAGRVAAAHRPPGLRDRAEELEWLEQAGWQLEGPIHADLGRAVHPDIPTRELAD